MEPVLNNKDEEAVEHARRVQRMEQMKQEKLLQEKRRRMLKQFLPMAVSVTGVVILLLVGIIAVIKKSDGELGIPSRVSETDAELLTQVEQINEQPQQITEQQLGTEGQNIAAANEAEEVTEDDAKLAVSDVIGVGMDKETGQPALQAKTVAPLYTFTSNDATATIYSEEVISTNAILIDESTDTIIASKGAKERINPASMTKVLTVLVAAEHITEADLDDTFTMTKEITDYAYVNDCSSVGFLDGEKVTVRDLFYGTVLPSGGDAAVGLATYIAGSHEAFVDMMNEKLKELGVSESAHFTNCVGLYDEDHFCTVYDMAVIMKAAVQNEMCREFLSVKTYTTVPTTEHPEGITISNWFLRRIEDKDTGGEVLCAKTGYVVESRNCAVSYGTFAEGTPYICVTVGATSSWRCIYDHVEIYNRYVPEVK